METVIWSRSGGQSIGSGKGILPRYAKVPYGYLAEKTSQDSDQLHCFCGRQIMYLTCTGHTSFLTKGRDKNFMLLFWI